MKSYADRGGCYPPNPKAEADNTLRDLHNSSYHTKAEFNKYCFIIHSKYFQSFNRVLSGSRKNRSLLENMNKKQEENDQQVFGDENFIQGSDKFAIRSKIRINYLHVRSPLNTI